MRTTLQLAQRLARHLAVEDASNLSSDAALDVLSAMNAGIQAYYRELPPMYRRTTISHTLRAPEEVEVSVTRYSTAVEAETFEPAMRGCTVRIPGGTADNEIVSEEALLDEHLGETGTFTATVYYDAAPIEDVIERLCGDVRFVESDACQGTLTREPRLRERGYRLDLSATPEISSPRYYTLDPVGGSQGGEPATLLRVYPLPARDMLLRFEAQLGPKLFTFAHLASPAKIPVPEERVDDLLLPLCEAELTTSPLWRDSSRVRLFLDRRDEVLGRRIPMVPSDYGTPRHRVGIPRGF